MAETVVNTLPQRGRGRPRDEEARSRILASALNLLENVGFSSTTMDAIADQAGASKATIYRWWPNKAAVLIEALREAVEHELPFPLTGNLNDDLRLQLQNFVRLLTGQRGRIFKAFIAAAQNDPEVAQAFRNSWIAPRRASAKAVLEVHQKTGALSPRADLDMLLDLIYGPLYFRLLAGHGQLSPDFADGIAEMALRGVCQN